MYDRMLVLALPAILDVRSSSCSVYANRKSAIDVSVFIASV